MYLTIIRNLVQCAQWMRDDPGSNKGYSSLTTEYGMQWLAQGLGTERSRTMRTNIAVSGMKVEGGKFVGTKLVVPMKISQGKCGGVYQYELEVDLDGVGVEQLLPFAGAALRIKVQGIREKGDTAVKEYIKTRERKFHDIIARQAVEQIKLETADDFVKYLDNLSGSELAKLKKFMESK